MKSKSIHMDKKIHLQQNINKPFGVCLLPVLLDTGKGRQLLGIEVGQPRVLQTVPITLKAQNRIK